MSQTLVGVGHRLVWGAVEAQLPGARGTKPPAFRAVSTDILHFRARVLGVYGQGLFMGSL